MKKHFIVEFVILMIPIFLFAHTKVVAEGNKIVFLDSLVNSKVNVYDHFYPSLDTTYYFANIGGRIDDSTMLVLGGKWGFVDTLGAEICPIEFDKVDDFINGLAFVCKNGRCGYINMKGGYVVPLDSEISINNIVPENYWNY